MTSPLFGTRDGFILKFNSQVTTVNRVHGCCGVYRYIYIGLRKRISGEVVYCVCVRVRARVCVTDISIYILATNPYRSDKNQKTFGTPPPKCESCGLSPFQTFISERTNEKRTNLK